MNRFKDFIERIHVCWHVLTKKNYVFFAVGKAAVVFDENGNYSETKAKKVAMYENTENDLILNTDKGRKSFKKMIWECVELFAKEQEEKIE